MADTPSRLHAVLVVAEQLCDNAYRWFYQLGMYALRTLHRCGRYWKRELRPSKIWFQNYVLRAVAAWAARVGARFSGVVQSFREEFGREHIPFFRHPFRAVGSFFHKLAAAVRQHPQIFGTIGRLTVPSVAVAVLALTLSYWTSANFGIEVEYEGTPVGYISDESTYRQAAELARSRVYSENGEFSISDTPKMTVTLVRTEPMLNDVSLCDEILRTKGDAIAEASGLYVDGAFIGSVESRTELDTVLADIKASYCTGAENERAEFIQPVEITDGLFLSESVMTPSEMKAQLTAQAVVKKEYTVQAGDTLSGIARNLDMTLSDLRAMNSSIKNDMIYPGEALTVQRPQPFLRVRVVRTIKYDEVIPFGTEKVYNKDKPVTYEKVKTAGVNGSQTVTAEVTYIDGIEQNRNILSIDVTKNAVTKVVEVGTKKVVTTGGIQVTVGDGVTTGSMVWPVPICHNMSRGYSSGHYAIDICNGPVTVRGKTFVAADGGTVLSASVGWNGGYGNMIRIRHDNGLITVYAHCQSLMVVTGQKVTRNQPIGIIGSTGRSTGPHLHFEVIKDGRKVNPLLYVKP